MRYLFLSLLFLNLTPNIMNHFLRISAALVLTSYSLFLISCSEDESDKNSAGKIILISPTTDDLLSRTVTIEASVELVDFDHAEIFLDNERIGQSAVKDVILSYDTKEIADGSYTLKIIAFDKDGKEVSLSTPVEIWNTLIKFSIPENYILSHQEMWVFVTSNEGEFIGSQQIQNNTEVSFETPEGFRQYKSVTVHQLIKSALTSTKFTQFKIESYTFLFPGVYRLKSNFQGPLLGQHTFVIKNKPGTYNINTYSGPDASGATTSSTPTEFTLKPGLKGNNTPLFYNFYNSSNSAIIPKYKYFPSANPGDIETAEFSTLSSMMTGSLPLGLQADDVSMLLAVFEDSGAQRSFVIGSTSDVNSESISYYYPGSLFTEFLSTITVKKGNIDYLYQKRGSLPTAIKYNTTSTIKSLNFSDNTLEVKSTGTFDLISVASTENWQISDQFYQIAWTYYTDDSGDHEFIIPELPSAIKEAYPVLSSAPGRVFAVATLRDYDSFQNYQEYTRFLLQSNENAYRFFTESTGLVVHF